MQIVLDIVNWCMANWQALLNGVVALMTALIAIFMLIPGDQPEKSLQSIVDFLSKFSKK